MNKAASAIEWVVGLGVAAWLARTSSETYILDGVGKTIVITCLYVPVALAVGSRLPPSQRLLLLTGFSLLMSLCVVTRISRELSLVAFPGWSSKEMGQMAPPGLSTESSMQWYIDHVSRVRSVRDGHVLISVILCLLFWCQFTRAQSENAGAREEPVRDG